MQVRPSVILIDDNKILLMKYNYGGNEVYALPGGNPDDGETLVETLIRELEEELNLHIAVSALVLAGEVIFPESAKSTLHCVFHGRILSGLPVLNPEHTSALGVEWVSLSETVDLNMYPNVGKHIFSATDPHSKTECQYIGRIQQNWF